MGNFCLYKIGQFLTRHLPLSVSYALAVFLSDCQYLLSKADREAVEANLKVVLNADQVPASMVRDVFHNFGKYLADFFTMTRRLDREFIKNSVQMTGVEHLNEVLHKGKGGIILSAHLGNWEMGAALLALLGYPVSIVALAHRDERVNHFFNSQREFFGATVIQTNVALRGCLEHLKRNRFIAILADRDFGHHGLPMDFLGRKAMIPQGAALFALKTGAPIIPVFFLRGHQNNFRITLGEPIDPPPMKAGHISDEDIEQLTKQYLPLIEEQIRQNPSQWLMFRRFENV
ncbi:MAG: lysophospholipid acyltransferase family protein [Candidatus Omnitrophica bacterium]|nr:lysophospholipid acyltransferase family protein [Candidatus Omnitrophota bacterium]